MSLTNLLEDIDDERAGDWIKDVIRKGWCSRSTWAIDSWLAECLSGMLPKLADDIDVGEPEAGCHPDDEITIRQQNALAQECRDMAEKFAVYEANGGGGFNTSADAEMQEAMDWLAKNWKALWT